MHPEFDLIAIGTGVAANKVARRCRAAGWTVAIVDDRPYGGTCALRGCAPKKVLVGIADAVDSARRLQGKGVVGEVTVRWGDLMRFKRSFTEPVPAQRERSLTDAGITTLHGRARFVGPTTVRIGDERLHGRRVLIGSGAKPADLPITGAELLATSDQFLDLDELPRRIVFVGGGFVSFELGHVARVAGAEVTILEMQDRPLASFDSDLVRLLVEHTHAMGIELHVDRQVEAIERRDGALLVRASAGDELVTLEADMVVHGAGRTPDIEDLDLEEAGVEYDESGIMVNEYMQSVSNPAVYAAGDAANGAAQLTPVADFEAYVAAANLLEGNHRQIEYPPIPSIVFSLPPLASVGLAEEEAREQGIEVECELTRTTSWFSSRYLGEEISGHKVLVEKRTGRILGAHLLGHKADELINLFAMAIRCELTRQELKASIFGYPTRASDAQNMV